MLQPNIYEIYFSHKAITKTPLPWFYNVLNTEFRCFLSSPVMFIFHCWNLTETYTCWMLWELSYSKTEGSFVWLHETYLLLLITHEEFRYKTLHLWWIHRNIYNHFDKLYHQSNWIVLAWFNCTTTVGDQHVFPSAAFLGVGWCFASISMSLPCLDGCPVGVCS